MFCNLSSISDDDSYVALTMLQQLNVRIYQLLDAGRRVLGHDGDFVITSKVCRGLSTQALLDALNIPCQLLWRWVLPLRRFVICSRSVSLHIG